MSIARFSGIKVAGIAAAVPTHKEIIAEKYTPIFGEKAVEQFSKMTGVVERHVASEEQTASDLAFVAAEKLLTEKGIDREKVGFCLFVTQTPDYRQPATACVLHQRLHLSQNCIAFDMNLGCSGYVYGLRVAAALMQTADIRYGLLLVGDTMTSLTAPTDSSSVMLFGDGGAATLLEKDASAPVIAADHRTNGEGFKTIIIPAGAYRNRSASHERTKWGDGNLRSDYDMYMDGMGVFFFTREAVPALITEFMEENHTDKDAVDCYAFHQANCYIMKQLVKLAKLDKDKMPISMDRYGNTSVTSIPLTLCDHYGACGEDAHKHIFSCGFGVGLSWGIVEFDVNVKDILPIIETDDYFQDGGISHD